MHRLQQHILGQLINNPSLRYADLKPAEVEGNLFMYHLRVLMKQGLVVKRPDGRYELSPDGKLYADTLSLKTLTPRVQPRLVTLTVCRNEQGEYLLFRRKRHPMLGWVGFPYGKIHLGETVAQAAARELEEKTGIQAQLAHRGDGYITFIEQDEPVSQVFFHLFVGANPEGKLRTDPPSGTVFWGWIEEVGDKLLPSVPDLLKLLAKHPAERFFCELEYHV